METSSPIPVFDKRLVDRRRPAQVAAERQKVAEQIALWKRTQHDPTLRAKDVSILRDRRASLRQLVQFATLDNRRSDTFTVAGQLLITKENLARAGAAGRELIGGLGLVATPIDALNGAVLRLDPAKRATVAASEATTDLLSTLRAAGVLAEHSYVVPLGMIRKAQGGPEPSSWTQTRPTDPAGGPSVAVIDTGISTEVRSDGWLTGLVLPGNVDELDVIPQPTDNRLDLAAGHGTFASGALQQVAPAVDLRMYQTLDTDGLASEADVAAAIVTAAQDGHQIVNLSLGTDTVDDSPPAALLAGVQQAIAINPDILLVCAAGNLGDTRPVWPAAFKADFPDNVVSVAALGRNATTGAIEGAAWSSHGDVTCSTMGEAVVSTYVIGTESVAADSDPDTFGPNSWATWSGTSFAAPQVAGAIVAVLQNPAHSGLTPRQALDVVLQSSVAIPGYGSAVVILPT